MGWKHCRGTEGKERSSSVNHWSIIDAVIIGKEDPKRTCNLENYKHRLGRPQHKASSTIDLVFAFPTMEVNGD